MPATQFDLTPTVLDIGKIVLGKELDLGIRGLKPVMLLKGGQQDLADQPRHLALLGSLHRQDYTDRLGRGRVVHIKRPRPPGRWHPGVKHLLIAQSGGAAKAQDQFVMVMWLM